MHDKRKALETIIEKLGKLLPHLGNENDGEALGAVRAITALLKKAGLDWHDLVALLHGNQPSFLEMLAGLVVNEADALVRLGRAGAAFADVRMSEHVLTLPLASREFQEWLGHQYFRETNKAPKLASERDDHGGADCAQLDRSERGADRHAAA